MGGAGTASVLSIQELLEIKIKAQNDVGLSFVFSESATCEQWWCVDVV